MRILLLRRLGKSGDGQDGAVAVITALLAVVMVILTAFAVDIGNAYAQARQLSVAADADALAAAAAVGEAIPPGTACTQSVLDGLTDGTHTGAVAIARATANALNTANNKSGANEPVESVSVTCAKANPTDTVNNAVEVRITTRRSVSTAFAGIIGIDEVSPNSYAVAQYIRVRTAGGLRPWAVCDATVKAAKGAPNMTFWTGIDGISGPCDTSASGNWGAVDFDGGNNSAVDLAAWTMYGYPGAVYIPAPPNPNLPADPGVSNKIQLRDAFRSIVGQVVLFPSVPGFNDETGKNPSGGSNANFPANGIVTARICGVKYSNILYTDRDDGNDTTDCWETPVPPLISSSSTPVESPSVPTTSAIALAKNTNILRTATAVFPPEPTDPTVTVSAAVSIAGAGPGGKALDTTVATFTSQNEAVLTDDIKTAVNIGTDVTVTVTTTTTTTTASGGTPLPANGPFDEKGDPLDHIQFRWVNYSTSPYLGANSEPCSLTDPLCVGATRLWR